MSIDIEELDAVRNDYRRANGAPQVVIDGKNERFSRPSSFADPLDDKSALVNWKIDRACVGVGRDRALQARWCAIDPDDKDQRQEKEKLRQDSISAGRGAEAADIGTALHAMSVRWENDPKFSPPEPYLSSLMAYEAQMKVLGLRSVLFEFQVVNVEHRCAGTADRLYELLEPLTAPDGTILEAGSYVIGDLKTGAKFEYSMPSYSVQMALYAGGQRYDVIEDVFIETPDINQAWSLIVHMPADDPGTCEFLWCDLEVGRYGAYIVDQVKLWRKNWRAGEFEFAIATTSEPQPTTIGLNPVEDGVVEVWGPEPVAADPDGPATGTSGDRLTESGPDAAEPVAIGAGSDGLGEPLDGHIAWAKERLAYIAQHDAAAKRLMARWPVGLPTPKQGIVNMEQVLRVNDLLSEIEAEFQLSFVPRPTSILGVGPSTHRRGK
jgi:hypothetical protein